MSAQSTNSVASDLPKKAVSPIALKREKSRNLMSAPANIVDTILTTDDKGKLYKAGSVLPQTGKL